MFSIFGQHRKFLIGLFLKAEGNMSHFILLYLETSAILSFVLICGVVPIYLWYYTIFVWLPKTDKWLDQQFDKFKI